MKTRICYLALALFMLPVTRGFSQTENFPELPALKSFKGVPGKVTKYNNFNYIDIQEEGQKTRQAMGKYWEVFYSYDSVFRQKRKFQEFMLNQIAERNGKVFFKDTTQVHFVIHDEQGNIWGRMVLSTDKSYRLRLIRESAFTSSVAFDTKPVIRFAEFVDSIALPPRLNYLPKAIIARAQYSKFDHQEFSWTIKDTLIRQKVMGPMWELKIEVRNSQNQIDKQVSSVEILENYYRACMKSGGTIIRSRPRELIFTLPMKEATLWTRIMISLDGVYFVRSILQSDKDKTTPQRLYATQNIPADSVKMEVH
ncbi:MAG: hypothetical protein PHY99_05550 [Bacteroidales bacterium]|nr:hypothetical protein [Bacteroidales bacterium]